MEGGVTVQEQLERVGWGRFQLIALAAFVLFLVSDGMELVVTNIIWQDLPLEEWGVDRDEHGKRGELVSLAFIGFVLGAFCSALLGDNIGRRPLFFLHGAIFLPMSLLSACSQSLLQLGATRFFVGISMGLVLPCVNSMMTELAPIEFRAKAVISIPGVAYSLGQVIVLLVGIALIRKAETGPPCTANGMEQMKCAWWRGMLVAGVIPDIIALALVYFHVPESPRYLICKGKREEVRAVLLEIARCNGTEDKLAHDGYCQPVADEPVDGGWNRWCDSAMLRPPLSTVLVLTVGLWCSISVVLFGGSLLFPIYLEQYLELSREQGYWLMLVMALIEIPGIFAVFTIIDRPDFGRRRTMMSCTAASACAALLLTFIWRRGAGALFVGNLLMRAVGALPYEIMYVYAAEVLPTSHRNTGLSLGQGASKIVASSLPLLLLPLVVAPNHSTLSLVRNAAAGGAGSSLSLLVSGFAAEQLEGRAEDAAANATVREAEPVDAGNSEKHGASASWGLEDSSDVSVPYLILFVSACIATTMIYYAPDASTSLYDTVTQADDALDSDRSTGRRLLDGSEAECRRLVPPSPTSGQHSLRGKKTVGSLYRLQT